MPTADVNGVSIYHEVTGTGFPLVLAHEAANDYQMWEPQVRFFARRYQVITWNQRGFPPSAVPDDPSAYSQETSVEDLHQLLRHLGIEQAHVAGLATGSNIALNFALLHPAMCRSLVVAGPGSGSMDKEAFAAQMEEGARRLEHEGITAEAAERGGYGPTRLAFLRKDPRGWRRWISLRAGHSALGAIHTLRGVLAKRPTVFELEAQLRQLQVPTLIMVGDEDEPCLEPALFLRRAIPHSGLAVYPQSGHPINLEEPELFNRTVLDFLTAVEQGGWLRREPHPAAEQPAGLPAPRG
jgi:pimeloyl-ACP methyl ester carboxylesterase